jgi:hypothetical protein
MRLFVLLDWRPGTAAYVSWIPQIVRTGGGWRSRLTAAPAVAAVTSWLEQEDEYFQIVSTFIDGHAPPQRR